MTKLFTYSETRQNLASILKIAETDGEVLITKRNGKKFVLRPVSENKSPLDVPGIDVGMTREEIIDSIREGREMEPRERRETYSS
jgi:prevent-host-death family protein